MVTQQTDDALTQMLADIALSTARLRVMVNEAHTLVERLEHRVVHLNVNTHPSPARNAQEER